MLVLFSGCAAPQWRLFERKVPDPLAVTGDVQLAWAQGAEWLEQDYSRGHPNPEDGKLVSTALSNSIGSPLRYEDNADKVIRDLRRANKLLKEQLGEVNAFLQAQQGKTVEGTGVNILGFTGSYWFWMCVIIFIIAIGGLPVILFVIRTLRSTIITTTRVVEELSETNPEAAEEFKLLAKRRMSTKEKAAIKKHKPYAVKAIFEDLKKEKLSQLN